MTKATDRRFTRLSAAAISLALVFILALATARPAHAQFGVAEFSGLVANSDGTSATQAGAHPDTATTTVSFPATGPLIPDGQVKDAIVDLPPGFIGNPQIIPTLCTYEEFAQNPTTLPLCPVDSQVGTVEIFLSGGIPSGTSGLYSLDPPPGYPALFGFRFTGVPVLLFPSVRSGSDYGLKVVSSNIQQTLPLGRIKATLWGVPADPSHDSDRGNTLDPLAKAAGALELGTVQCTSTSDPRCSNSVGYTPAAFITSPSDCAAGPLPTSMEADSWEEPGLFHSASFNVDTNGNPTAVQGCDQVPFTPDLAARPTQGQADSPSGLDVELTMPTDGLLNPLGTAQAPLMRAKVTLPQGMSVNPSSADGLDGCSSQQVGLLKVAPDPTFTPDPANCPDASKIGTVTIDTPLLGKPLNGSVFLAKQDDNPFKSLLALYLAVDDPETGIVLKLPGRVDPRSEHGPTRSDLRRQSTAPVLEPRSPFQCRTKGATRDSAGLRLLQHRLRALILVSWRPRPSNSG